MDTDMSAYMFSMLPTLMLPRRKWPMNTDMSAFMGGLCQIKSRKLSLIRQWPWHHHRPDLRLPQGGIPRDDERKWKQPLMYKDQSAGNTAL